MQGSPLNAEVRDANVRNGSGQFSSRNHAVEEVRSSDFVWLAPIVDLVSVVLESEDGSVSSWLTACTMESQCSGSKKPCTISRGGSDDITSTH